MEPNSDPPPFWPPSPPIHRRRSYSPPFISLPVLIILLPTLALILLFFAIRPLLSLINQVYKPSSVKKSWDSFNVFLVLFAIICGIFSRRNDDVPTTADGDTRGSDQMTVVDTGGVKVNGDSESSQQWFGFSERRFSDPTGRAPVTTRLRRNSSYPDLRQESLWGNGDDSNNQFRFFDDFEINKFRSRSFVYRTRGNEREESPAIPVDSFVVNSSPAPEKMKSQSPNPPPPPPPPLPVTQRKPRRTYQNIQKKEEIPENKAEFTPPPPPPLPPRTVIPPSPVRVRLEEKFGKSVRKKTNVKKEIAMALASLVHSESPPPPPPPPPPVPSSSRSTKKKIQIPRPPSPPPPPPPPAQQRNSTTNRRPPLPTSVRNSYIENPSINSREKSLTPTIPPPPPPPPSFKTTTDVKSTVGSDTVGSRSSETSRCGSPDPENVNTSASGGAGVGSVFCPSPDVNVKAANFIARLRGEWRLEKMNSVREKERLGQGPNYEITTGLGPNV
ncbi:formin-like protein 20 [Cucumis sativus]|uniref:formin-like protein 20 n=1 Tax=Cucumis sativus TaxID=3659 RepID=UPI0012F4936B|nr:formin-like protein 20 [Cucumis sativus]